MLFGKIFACKKFGSSNIEDRKNLVYSPKLCFNCLCPGHLTKDCKSRHLQNVSWKTQFITSNRVISKWGNFRISHCKLTIYFCTFLCFTYGFCANSGRFFTYYSFWMTVVLNSVQLLNQQSRECIWNDRNNRLEWTVSGMSPEPIIQEV